MTRGPKIAHTQPRIVPRKRTANSRRTTALISSRWCQALTKGVSKFISGAVSNGYANTRRAANGAQRRPMAPDVDQFEPLPSTLARRSIHRGGARVQMLPRINSQFSVYSWHLSHSCGDGKIGLEVLVLRHKH